MKVCDMIMQEVEFGKGQLLLVGGRPSMGKTSFARSVAVEMAKNGSKVGYVTLEMSRDQLLKQAAKNKSSATMAGPQIDIIDEAPESVADIEKNCAGQGYDMLIIDYLQLIDREESSIEEVTKKLRKLADKLSCPVFVLSQLSRQIENREDHMPRVDDIAAGGINPALFEQVFLLYRGYYYDRTVDPARLVVVKKDGKEELEWDYESLSVL